MAGCVEFERLRHVPGLTRVCREILARDKKFQGKEFRSNGRPPNELVSQD
jgi:hypothetical protein